MTAPAFDLEIASHRPPDSAVLQAADLVAVAALEWPVTAGLPHQPGLPHPVAFLQQLAFRHGAAPRCPTDPLTVACYMGER